MPLKPHALGVAAAFVTGLFYIVDGLYYMFAPESALSFFSYISHNFDFSILEGEGVTWASFLIGLVVWEICAYISTWLFAIVYNRLANRP